MSRRLLALLILATTLPCLAKSKPVTVGVAPVEAGSRPPASVATVVQNAIEEELAREAAVRQDLRSLLAIRLTPGRVRLAGLAATVT